MKCQNCGINFDDADRECPMCGKKSGQRGRLSAPQGTGSIRVRSAESTQRSARASAERRITETLNGKPANKGSGKAAGVIATVIALLLGILPVALDWLDTSVDEIRYAIEDAINGFGDDGYHADDGYYDDYENLIYYPMLEGRWRIDRADGSAVALTVDEEDYYTMTVFSPAAGWSTQENGYLTLWREPQEDGAYDDRYPPEEYDCYSLYLYREQISLDNLSEEDIPEDVQTWAAESTCAMLVYHPKDADEGVYMLYGYLDENLAAFPDEAEMLARTQGA